MRAGEERNEEKGRRREGQRERGETQVNTCIFSIHADATTESNRVSFSLTRESYKDQISQQILPLHVYTFLEVAAGVTLRMTQDSR